MERERSVWRRGAVALVLVAFAALGAISSIVVPPFETPDEIWHYAFIQQVASGGGLPLSEPATRALWRQQGAQAPGYYLAAAALTAWIDQSDFPDIYERANPHAAIGVPYAQRSINYLLHYRNEGWPWRGSILALHVARFFSVALGVATLWASYRLLRLLVGEEVALLSVALFAFIPQFVFISGATSNDNAINALAALLLWRLVVLLKEAPPRSGAPDPAGLATPWRSPRSYLLIGLLLGLALLAKISGLWLLPLTFFALGIVAYRLRSWRTFGESALLVGGLALLLAGWWYWRNWRLYGDWLATNIWLSNILLRLEPAGWRVIAGELESLHHSFWGLFGWFNVAYPAWLYRAFQAVEFLVASGLLLTAVRTKERGVPAAGPRGARSGPDDRTHTLHWRRAGLALLFLWLIAITISWLGFMRIAAAAQGRYFHPAAPAIAMLMAVGLRAWRIPGTRFPVLAWGVVAGLFLVSAATSWWILRPVYTPSAAVAATEPVTIFEGDEGAFGLQAAEIRTKATTPGSVVEMELVWQIVEPPARDWSLFVHLVRPDGVIVAQ
ncbi:MAG: glycosyltransferase family 39 protein, partial [Ardenticatenaceae bacterium]